MHRPLAPLLAVALAACSSEGTGTLALRLTDAPADLTHAATIDVTIDDVRAHVAIGDDDDDTEVADTTVADTLVADTADTDDDVDVVDATGQHSGWRTICAAPGTFDLLTLTDGLTTALCPDATIPAGRVTQLRLVVSAAEVTWDDGRPASALTIPSKVVKILGPKEELPVGGRLEVTLDFDAGESIHEADGKLILRPTIRVVR